MYVSDYYLQAGSKEMERYEYLNDNKENYGVFTLNEGATFRHHTKEWINKLLGAFRIVEENRIEGVRRNTWQSRRPHVASGRERPVRVPAAHSVRARRPGDRGRQ